MIYNIIALTAYGENQNHIYKTETVGVINVILKKKVIVTVALLLAVVTIALVGRPSQAVETVSAETEIKPKIILDAGHGGFDGGAVAQDGTVEKDINLKICITLAEFLRCGGYEVIMTRSEDVSTDDVGAAAIATRKKSDLKNRLELMNTYPDAIFVSVHLNKFTTSTANGSQVFYSGTTEESAKLGEFIRAAIVGLLQPENERVNKQATSGTYLLYNATVPAVLVECGFLSNQNDLQLLKNEEYQEKMAFCIYCGIAEYFKDSREI